MNYFQRLEKAGYTRQRQKIVGVGSSPNDLGLSASSFHIHPLGGLPIYFPVDFEREVPVKLGVSTNHVTIYVNDPNEGTYRVVYERRSGTSHDDLKSSLQEEGFFDSEFNSRVGGDRVLEYSLVGDPLSKPKKRLGKKGD